jgi:predicted CxxxxCH...CXXCH cytochrome family protein
LSSSDASTIFGGHTTHSGTKHNQTSHRWDGSDFNPAAGAVPPVQAAMTSSPFTQGSQGKPGLRGRSGNQLACVRCHSMHISNNQNGSALRMANDKDQMCLDCHAPRDKQTHTSGTHPVSVNYIAAANNNPSKFNPMPVNTNPANPTSDLGTKLAQVDVTNQSVVCSTCHGAHYTDSRSSTVDGSLNSYANLSAGDGYILRTDRRGGKVSAESTFQGADKLNLCTNCHTNKKSHNAANQDVQCNDCHGAHVEYDKDDPNKLIKPNVYLIRRDVAKAGVAGKVYFRYTGSQREYKNANGTGVCQGCHEVPAAGGKYPPEHDRANATECNTCHYHGSQAGSFSGACGKCHGNPPTTIAGMVSQPAPTNALAAGQVGAHDMHVNTLKMNCNACHNRYGNKEMPSKTIDLEFAINPGTVSGFKGVATNPAAYNTAAAQNGYTFIGDVNVNGQNSTCSTVYCHGGTLLGGTNSTPSWVSDIGNVGCGTCHAVDLASLGSSHPSHTSAPAGCDSCHPVIGSSHMQGSVQWKLSNPASQYKIPGGIASNAGETGRVAPSMKSLYGSCSNIICHGQGSPTWGATAAAPVNGFPYSASTCGKCHSESGTVTAATPFYSTAIPKVTANTDPKVGAHTAHLASTTDSLSANITCNDCHNVTAMNSAGHMNGSTTPVWGALATGLKGSSTGLPRSTPTYSTTNRTCSNTYCHGDTLTGGTQTSPSWDNPASHLPSTISAAGCGMCHGFPPPGHNFTAPTTFPAAAASCSCHPNINPSGTSYADIFVLKSKHIDGVVEGGGCNGCHGYPPASPSVVASAGNYEFSKPESYLGSGGAHTVEGHVSKAAVASDGWANCKKCHTQGDHKESPKVFLPSTNVKVNLDARVRFDSAVQPKYSSNKKDGALHVSGTCSSVACHFQKTPKW